ncbi:CoA pyrophosphatase [Streptococcus suis]|uniref:NTP pyrophosphohydrolase including oxidative damage repair enzyme n=1 Tax=Streptococcus suis TaxID=1307 RepID=A0A0Z8BUF8_STRSU|nr:CoA pyrophosphatase [Streptococcus suis]NQH93255.1 CoA pyrophosphatase [Streptococcus suis]NQI12755.1 CoA pyrophosphatase [Streptococcus suis]NQO72908.1 CoA pyrophosphatase [Streptococcus suis]CYU13353.1 NTP pyrophosphohydrolase including oxidative damage repair enzyme [Streptococcus suis]CYU37506.1 NTP pyrophosphohydrolase including oxidative damage repair enzyme [Streptococcus suis]
MTDQLQALLKDYQPQPLGEKRSYAVFLPLVWSDNQWQVLYEIRSESISQPGEVSFPGGGIDEGETAEEAAIREVIEELDIQQEQIDILGEIDYLVLERSTVHCFVGRLNLDWTTILPNEEVARIFTVPLSTLLTTQPVYYQLDSQIVPDCDFPFERLRGGVDYPFSHHKRSVPFYENLPENIWGMTAQFTHRFVEIVKSNLS